MGQARSKPRRAPHPRNGSSRKTGPIRPVETKLTSDELTKLVNGHRTIEELKRQSWFAQRALGMAEDAHKQHVEILSSRYGLPQRWDVDQESGIVTIPQEASRG